MNENTAKSIDKVIQSLKMADSNFIFGEPVDSCGKTVIPVGKIKCGYGFGFGDAQNLEEESNESGKASGGGAGTSIEVIPAGYIEITHRRTRFVKISRVSPVGMGLVVLGLGMITACHFKRRRHEN